MDENRNLLIRSGALSLTVGILSILFGVTVGVLSIVNGARMLHKCSLPKNK